MSGSGANRFRTDGSYRSNEGQAKLSQIRSLADEINGSDLSRMDSMTVFAVIDLLDAVVKRQQAKNPMPKVRPGRWGRIEPDQSSA